MPRSCKVYMSEFEPTPYCGTLTITLTLIFDLSTPNHVISGHSLYQVLSLCNHSFLSYAPTRVLEMHLLTL